MLFAWIQVVPSVEIPSPDSVLLLILDGHEATMPLELGSLLPGAVWATILPRTFESA